MRSPRRFAGLLASAAVLAAGTEAHAAGGDSESLAYGALGLAVVDVGFLVYDGWRVGEGSIDRGAMIAQTAVWSPQAAAFNFGLAWGQVDDEDSAGLTLGFMIPSIWANSMATFGAWTVASERLDIADRFAVSWLVGSNVTFTTGAITSLFRPTPVATPYFSTPEAIIQSAQTIGCIVWAARDEEHRGEWLALGAWSALLATHGFVSIIAWDDRPPGAAPSGRREVAPNVTAIGPFGSGPGFSFAGTF